MNPPLSPNRSPSGPHPKKRALIEELLRRFPQEDRQRLHAQVLHGDVLVNGHRERNPKTRIAEEARIDLEAQRYVSRGGEKLDSVLHEACRAGFAYPGAVLLDAGASTGGFSDCLLRQGAAAVHAVDVGYNQLDYRLRSDERVHVHERCNIMALSRGDLQPEPSLAVADLSFRSLAGAASHIIGLLEAERPLLLALIKPQFELKHSGMSLATFSGVLSDDAVVARIVDDLCRRLEKEGLEVFEFWPSGLRGSGGNQEFFGLIGPGLRGSGAAR